MPELRRLARENRFYEWNDLVAIQSEDGAFMCQATPKGSYGEYLYIRCWEVEQESTIITTMDEDDDHTTRLRPAQVETMVLLILGMHQE